ncbi:MAG: hypothetical protein KAJ16_06265, partial [Calditrichia bacterium]|nr:hypothetical protein [Calditrichia bacterium]
TGGFGPDSGSHDSDKTIRHSGLEEDGYFIESEPYLTFLFEQVFATSLNSSNISSNFSPRKYIYEHPLEFFSSQQILT